jgi:hypothetical protein
MRTIKGTRISKLDRHFAGLAIEEPFVCAITDVINHTSELVAAGFSLDLAVGETVLPAPGGPASHLNAEGRHLKLTDLPMETYYTDRMWTRQEWHGPYRREVTDIVSIPRKRYQREFIPPPAVELTVRMDATGEKLVCSQMTLAPENAERVLHVVNLFLDLFGECTVLREDLRPLIPGAMRRLNWHVLPPGRHPWATLEPHVREVLQRQAEAVRPVMQARIEAVNGHGPNFIACGKAGFQGYLIFGFEKQNLYVLESAFPDNATYVFRENWEQLSQFTKAEILADHLHHQRLIHKPGWSRVLASLLNERAA